MRARKKPDFKAVARLVVARLTDEERARSVAYLDEALRPPGRAAIGGEEVEVDHPYVVAFIDDRPGSNWMHPCRYLLIDPANENVTPVASSRPPLFGLLPPTWHIVWRSPGVADWQLLPMSRPSPQERHKR